MSRIEQTFMALKARGKTGVITYVTVGFPNVEATMEIVPAIVEAGADIIELGVPFSDPLADGATIQHASQVALDGGITLATCIDVCRKLRAKLPEVPLVFFGYYNPILAYGLERFGRDAEAAGADGVIVPDLPPEEAEALLAVCKTHGIDVIFLLAPTSTERRIEAVGRLSGGFIYCVSLTGVTGARAATGSDVPGFLERVRRRTTLPLAVGFGISTAEHVRTIGKVAEAVAVGSALISAIDGPDEGRVERASTFVRELSLGAGAALSVGNPGVVATMVSRGIRGATTADANTKEAILAATRELLLAIIDANNIKPDDVAFALFSTTRDLNAEFPAAAARLMGGGWEDVALMCSHEMDVPDAMPSVVRVMLLVNTEKSAKQLKNIYLKDTIKLRQRGVVPDGAGSSGTDGVRVGQPPNR